MKNRKNALFLIILFVGIFFIPGNVKANPLQDIYEQQREKYNKVFEDFKSNAEKSSFGAVICHISMDYQILWGKEGTDDLYWLVQSNGDGTATIKTNHDLKFTIVKKNELKHTEALYYDKKTNKGVCPSEYYIAANMNYGVIAGGNEIQITATKKKYPGIAWGPIEFARAIKYYDADDFYMEEVYNNGKQWLGDGVVPPSDNFSECTSLLGDPEDDDSLAWLINKILLYFKIIVPIIILILSSIDFIKAMIINDDDTMKKAQKKLITRIILAISLFLVSDIMPLLFDIFGLTSDNCIK